MLETEALKIAQEFVRNKKLAVGQFRSIRLMSSKARPDTQSKGDLWRVFYDYPTAPNVFREPDVIIIHVEDSTGEVSEFDVL
jgi:hypothetical protein